MSYYRSQSSNYYRPSLFGGFRFFPQVIKYLLISNTIVFILTAFFGMFRVQGVSLGAVFNTLFPLYPIGEGFQLWQLFTYMFMHGGLMHLFFNMFALWMFGMQLENDWGSRKFFSYYMICGIGAGISNLLIGPIFGPSGPTVGASGAIYGVLLAFGMSYPDQPIFIYFLLPIRARYFVIIYIVLELYSGIAASPDGIAHFAHLGGAAIGFIYLMIERRKMPLNQYYHRAKEKFVTSSHANHYSSYDKGHISDATYYDIHEDDHGIDQQRIDEILDKISQYGYQSLTEEEKKILFEASKKLN